MFMLHICKANLLSIPRSLLRPRRVCALGAKGKKTLDLRGVVTTSNNISDMRLGKLQFTPFEIQLIKLVNKSISKTR